MINPFKYFRFLQKAADDIDRQNEETEQIIKNAKAMLDGEDGWFLGVTDEDEDIKLTCICKKADTHAD